MAIRIIEGVLGQGMSYFPKGSYVKKQRRIQDKKIWSLKIKKKFEFNYYGYSNN